MDKETRNRIQRATQNARALLEREYAEQLEGTFDIRLDGTIAAEPGMHLDAEQCVVRDKLVAAVEHRRAGGFSRSEAVAAYRREAAFTTLNRFVALKMLEARGLVQECMSRGEQSSGFKEFTGLAPGLVQLPDHGYRLYIESLFDEIGREVRVLFDRRDPASLLWLRRQALLDLLAIINTPELGEVWQSDETIGWIYQYFNSDEERRQMRTKSQAPRNSHELAVRNQFFTPRYVVEFLTDNTLSRIWYEMCQGETRLVDKCDYLVRRPVEIFLAEGEELPINETGDDESLSPTELLKKPVYIPFRPKKDPRDIKVLDPACGSGHFLLYSFDLLVTIYEEGWEDEAAPNSDLTGYKLGEEYPSRGSLRAALPGLILRHNLHGIDIDPRCAQIAALALWMRTQRAYNDFGVARAERQPIARTNIVVAESMPGEEALRAEFVASLDKKLGLLVERVFDRMTLAGEAGSLLKIEDDIRAAIREVYGEHGELFQKSDEDRWLDAEGHLLNALRTYAEQAQNGRAYARRLFAEDAARGFAFIDLWQRRYDVVLMNPPFGEFPKRLRQERRDWYPNTWQDILTAFTERLFSRLIAGGRLGAITSRTGFFLPSMLWWREKLLIGNENPVLLVDLGDQVMDSAMVESAAYVVADRAPRQHAAFFRVLGDPKRHETLREAIGAVGRSIMPANVFFVRVNAFKRLRQCPLAYWPTQSTIRKIERLPRLVPDVAQARQGLVTGDANRFVRVFWEVLSDHIETCGRTDNPSARWFPYVMRGSSQPWYAPITVVVNWAENGWELRNFFDDKGELRSRPRAMEFYFRPGFSWTRRAVRFVPYIIPMGCIPSASRYMTFPPSEKAMETLGIVASNVVSAFFRFYGEWFCRPNFLVEHLKELPWPTLDDAVAAELRQKVTVEVRRRQNAYTLHEPFQEFIAPNVFRAGVDSSALTYLVDTLLGSTLDTKVSQAYGLSSTEESILLRDLREAIAYQRSIGDDIGEERDQEDGDEDDTELLVEDTPESRYEAAISYLLGVAFGRWDVRLVISPELLPPIPEDNVPLPNYPLGGLLGADGRPALEDNVLDEAGLRARVESREWRQEKYRTSAPAYPHRIAWNGILVDDSGHPDDIGRTLLIIPNWHMSPTILKLLKMCHENASS